jgi:glycosyltransferase involved in cell wall biosynthesis
LGSKFLLYIDVALTRFTGFVGYFSIISTLRIIRQIRKIRPDIIHLHNIHGYYLNIPILLNVLSKLNSKIIWTLHDEFMYTGKCGYAQNCLNFQSQCHQCPLVKEYPKSLLFDWTRAMYLHKKRMLQDLKNLVVVTPSKWLAERVQTSFLSNNEIIVINNGINTEVFKSNLNRRNFTSLKKEVKILSLIANLDDDRKGHYWIPRIAEKLSGYNVKFYIVGSGKKKYFKENIRYIDKTNNVNDLVGLYQSADLFLILSEFENYPTVCLEASAIGLPIIGFNVGGVEEAIGNVYYKLVEFGNLEIVRVIQDFTKNDLGSFSKPKEIDLGFNVMTMKYQNLYRNSHEN